MYFAYVFNLMYLAVFWGVFFGVFFLFIYFYTLINHGCVLDLFFSSSGASVVAIDNKIEQAMVSVWVSFLAIHKEAMLATE